MLNVEAAGAVRKSEAEARAAALRAEFGQVVLVLQGGGALGAYQAGVYEALHEAGIEPDWVIGTSIGAINASLIAGNGPEDRLDKLKAFWKRVEHSSALETFSASPWLGAMLPNWSTMAAGIAGFFRPNPLAFLGSKIPLSPEAAGYYSTAPLRTTLNDLVDFERIRQCHPRLTVGAANVRTSEMRYFDSRDMPLTASHVAASGALPPAFPPVDIDGELFWDGGILSNTPVEVVFDDNPRKNSLIFAAHLWSSHGPPPGSMHDVAHRQKEIQYSSRAITHVARQRQIHRLRHVIAELAMRLPESDRALAEVREMAAHGCLTRMHIVCLLAPRLDGEDQTKDIDFGSQGIRRRWDAGLADTRRVLTQAPWRADVDPHEGLILHEFESKAETGEPNTAAGRAHGRTATARQTV